jgi:hypothetical protein
VFHGKRERNLCPAGSADSEDFTDVRAGREIRGTGDPLFGPAEFFILKFLRPAARLAVQEAMMAFRIGNRTNGKMAVTRMPVNDFHSFEGFDDPVYGYGVDRFALSLDPSLDFIRRRRFPQVLQCLKY